MITLVFPAPRLEELAAALAHASLESAAILLARPVDLGGGNTRLLVIGSNVAEDGDYASRTATGLTLKTEFCLPVEKRAITEGLSLIYCHTHPNTSEPQFSPIDDAAEIALKSYLAARGANSPHLALLFSASSCKARRLGAPDVVRVLEVGAKVITRADEHHFSVEEETFNRQILAFGPEGQARIAAITVGIVGLGGTGSIVLQQLAHLGVRRFFLVDDDLVEQSNLNRLAGAVPSDVSTVSKVDVAKRMVLNINPGAFIESLQANVLSPGMGEKLAAADFVFSCTDTQASRHLLNQMAYQYYVPVIDMGVAIRTGESSVRMAGHVKMIAPGLPCLWCVNHLDPAQVRLELMTAEQSAADPYFQGGPGVPQPAVISLNSTVASLAVTMFLSAVAGIPSPPRYILYDGTRARANAVEASANPACPFCGPNSTVGFGSSAPLPVRR